jgi:hypothetical protein
MSDTYADLEEMECNSTFLFTTTNVCLFDLVAILTLSVTVMDARNMEFIPDQCFDLVIDKGTVYASMSSTTSVSNIALYVFAPHSSLRRRAVLGE